VCPFEPNRVWYSIKYIGANTGPVLGKPATGRSVESPVQAHSITFNEKGEVTKFTSIRSVAQTRDSQADAELVLRPSPRVGSRLCA
jgi:hypothetical protein